MDLLLIPILLSLGGGLIYLSLNGAPRVSFEQFTGRFNRDPFKLNDWMHRRPAVSRARANQVSPEDAELVDLMNEMIAVREQLTDLKLARAPRPIRRQARKPAIAAAPVVTVELSVAVEEPAPTLVRETTPVQKSVPAFERPATRETSSKLPQPVRATTEMPAMPKELLKQTTTKVTEKKPAAEKSPAAEKQTPARRPSYTGHNRRYVRT